MRQMEQKSFSIRTADAPPPKKKIWFVGILTLDRMPVISALPVQFLWNYLSWSIQAYARLTAGCMTLLCYKPDSDKSIVFHWFAHEFCIFAPNWTGYLRMFHLLWVRIVLWQMTSSAKLLRIPRTRKQLCVCHGAFSQKDGFRMLWFKCANWSGPADMFLCPAGQDPVCPSELDTVHIALANSASTRQFPLWELFLQSRGTAWSNPLAHCSPHNKNFQRHATDHIQTRSSLKAIPA